ncbi:MAG: aminomethyltransferase [Acidimicrobiaceae bacterium]|nr:aminomethyltransferase [Acidimicrobiaceae bacterium]
MSGDLRRSALHDRHVALGAKLVPFGGWEMPLSYPLGTIDEHLACRRDAVVFDVSHLGTVRVAGPDALARLQAAFTNDLGKIAPGRAQYTHLLDEVDASVLDDIIVWWIAADVFDVMPNASNTARVLDAVGGDDVTATRVILAVQGPQARALVGPIFPEAAAVARFRVQQLTWLGQPVTVAGTGYTGEDGIEISVPVALAGALWDAIVGAGVTPAGLGARDTLRLEAALPLHGHELGPGITPLEAGLGWVVAWDKEFRGKIPLEARRRAGVGRRLRGLATAGRRPPRAECAVSVAGVDAGIVTSGNYSPVLEHGIALALLTTSIEDGQTVEIDVRGSSLPGVVVPTPFVAKR